MPLTLTPDINALVQQHLASGAYRSPHAVLASALHALQEGDAMREKKPANGPARDAPAHARDADRDVLPIVRWLQETARPRMGLKALRRRLAKKLTGTMAATVREGRDERV